MTDSSPPEPTKDTDPPSQQRRQQQPQPQQPQQPKQNRSLRFTDCKRSRHSDRGRPVARRKKRKRPYPLLQPFREETYPPHLAPPSYEYSNPSEAERDLRNGCTVRPRSVIRFGAFVALAVLVAFVSNGTVDGAHSRRRVAARTGASPTRYDRSITTFDPSGRLLQVEYGAAAADRGSAAIAASTPNDGIYLVLERPAAAAAASTPRKVHRLADHLWLVASGLSGDVRYLASTLRSYCQQHRASYGEVPTTEEVARHAASVHHLCTRTGGARPLGCSCLVLGADPDGAPPLSEQGDGADRPLRMYRVDPGGSVEECRYCAIGRGREAVMSSLSERYGDVIEARSSSAPFAASSLIETLTDHRIVDKESGSVDVWRIRRSPASRGDMRATCLLRVPCANAKEVIEGQAPYLDL